MSTNSSLIERARCKSARDTTPLVSGVLFCLTALTPIIASTTARAAGVNINVLNPPYSATGDGTTNDRAAIQSAIDAASSAGGGIVELPGGHTYLSGDLQLSSGVTL